MNAAIRSVFIHELAILKPLLGFGKLSVSRNPLMI